MEPQVKSLHSGSNEIELFLHCTDCCLLGGQEDYDFGWTPAGFQVWCKRHKLNVIHLDFLGQKVSTK